MAGIGDGFMAKTNTCAGSLLVKVSMPSGAYTRLGSLYQHDFRIAPPTQ